MYAGKKSLMHSSQCWITAAIEVAFTMHKSRQMAITVALTIVR